MKNGNPKMVEILNERGLIFKCKRCGQVWYPNHTPEGRLRWGAWQCPNGCKLKDLEEVVKGQKVS